jgi:hypothetical protein
VSLCVYPLLQPLLTVLQLLLPNSPSPESATLSENGNGDSEQEMAIISIGPPPKPGRVRTPVKPTHQTPLADASSTEGTPSPRSAMAHRLSGGCLPERQNPSQALNPSKKRAYESTPEPELDQPVLRQQATSASTLNQDPPNRSKLSAVNSPWIFRRT